MSENSIVNIDFPVIAWWSGGVTSAVTCKIAVDWFGRENVRIVFIDTKNEDDDTYRFLRECEGWYDRKIETIASARFASIQQVWNDYESLNTATGAICSTHLKLRVREAFQSVNKYSYQAFGFDITEINRARGLSENNRSARAIFPLIASLLTKKDCIKIIQGANSLFVPISIPRAYKMGFGNNNCFKTGCVQGGIGYWQKIQRETPEKFLTMARVEHNLTNIKGWPVTMLKDQSIGGGLVFLLPHPDYPHVKDISMMEGREPKPLVDCNGFCGSGDRVKTEAEAEINYQVD